MQVQTISFTDYLEAIRFDIQHRTIVMCSVISINGSLSVKGNTDALSSREDRKILKVMRRACKISLLGVNTLLYDTSAVASRNVFYIIPVEDKFDKLDRIIKVLQNITSKVLLLCEERIAVKLKEAICDLNNLTVKILPHVNKNSLLSYIDGIDSKVLIEGGRSTYTMFVDYVDSLHLTLSPNIISCGCGYPSNFSKSFKLKFLSAHRDFVYTYYVSENRVQRQVQRA